MAYRPSLERAFAWYGSTTLATFDAPRRAMTDWDTAALPAGSVSFCPAGATNTTRAEAPPALACGNRSASWSMATCDSVPGVVKELDVWPDRVAAPIPTSASSNTHSPATNQRRRNEKRPIRYRKVATLALQCEGLASP